MRKNNSKQFMNDLFNPQGRTRRRDYFIINLICTIIYVPIYFSVEYLNHSFGDLLFLCIFLFFFFPFIIIVTIKRFHDIGYSGWATLLMFVPILNIGGGFLLLFKDGTIGTNKYGNDPKRRIPKGYVIDDEIKEDHSKEIKQEKICTNCGVANKITLRYCMVCGYELPKNEIMQGRKE